MNLIFIKHLKQGPLHDIESTDEHTEKLTLEDTEIILITEENLKKKKHHNMTKVCS